MEILNRLSSRQGDKTEKSNKAVAELCIKDPQLLNDIVKAFTDKDRHLRSDGIEVFTIISETHPALIIPHAEQILPLLADKDTKTRWEAVHTLSYIASSAPDIIGTILLDLQVLIERDKSTIVRDYAADTVAAYAGTGKEQAGLAFNILRSCLEIWDEKHAKQVFKGFNLIIGQQPAYKTEIAKIVRPYLDAKRGTVAKEAKKLLKRIEN